jgi:hypothetical protein
MGATQMTQTKLACKRLAAVKAQRAWIAKCGGNLDGHIRKYGLPGEPRCHGNGGRAIYNADMMELHKLEAELRRCRCFTS